MKVSSAGSLLVGSEEERRGDDDAWRTFFLVDGCLASGGLDCSSDLLLGVLGGVTIRTSSRAVSNASVAVLMGLKELLLAVSTQVMIVL